MNETNMVSENKAEYQIAQIGPKSPGADFQTSSSSVFSRSVCVPENGKTVLIRIVPRTPRPTDLQSRTD